MSTIAITTFDTRRGSLRETGSLRPVVAARPVRTSAPVRLTRRGRVVVLAAVLAVVALAAVLLGSSTVATGEAGAVPQTQIVTVTEGQTLWQIASDVNPGGDVRDTVDDIIRMNSLPGAQVQLGAKLAVPVYE